MILRILWWDAILNLPALFWTCWDVVLSDGPDSRRILYILY